MFPGLLPGERGKVGVDIELFVLEIVDAPEVSDVPQVSELPTAEIVLFRGCLGGLILFRGLLGRGCLGGLILFRGRLRELIAELRLAQLLCEPLLILEVELSEVELIFFPGLRRRFSRRSLGSGRLLLEALLEVRRDVELLVPEIYIGEQVLFVLLFRGFRVPRLLFLLFILLYRLGGPAEQILRILRLLLGLG